jgi:tRNA(fMet)-specific endonuclease VapC
MNYMLDTDTFSYLVKGSHPVQQAALKINPDQIKISVVTQAEVWFGLQLHPSGAQKSGAQKQARIRELFEGIEVLTLDSTVAASYAVIRAKLHKTGTLIGPNDLWIAAHALCQGMTLVTNNTREFKRVPGLKLENWVGA